LKALEHSRLFPRKLAANRKILIAPDESYLVKHDGNAFFLNFVFLFLMLFKEEGSKTSEVAVYQTYCHRWYVLTAFSLFSFVQTLVWNTWGPISISAKAALDFTDRM